jgi:phosphoribosylaminoimidazole carboxylase (NCAIR synthetase)
VALIQDKFAQKEHFAAAGVPLPRFAALRDRVRSPRMWGTVADQAGLLLNTHAERARGAEVEAAKGLLGVLKGYAAE